MELEEQLDAAWKKETPIEDIRDLLKDLVAQGEKPETILAKLENYRHTLQRMGRYSEEDVILEVMDFLTGWCSQQMKI
ncbi:MAG TPA: hypothetical protein VMP08_02085 [Anaerolineae bacterium]|nr:hypothetical protein [Anaerolineae bacterium]